MGLAGESACPTCRQKKGGVRRRRAVLQTKTNRRKDYITSTPILRAVPATLLMAASRSKQFRSGILILAISSICFLLILPTLVLCGSADPLARLTARLISTGTGGVLVMKVNERSEKMVITTGMMRPS